MKKKRILMVGPARKVKGGMSSVVNNYFESDFFNDIDLKYIETTNDKKLVFKVAKMISGLMTYLFNINKYDIVHIHMASRVSTFRKGIYLNIAKKLNKKVILHIHGGEYKLFVEECNDRKKNKVIKILNSADKIIVLSEEWKEFFSKIIDSSKIEIIYNSIEIPKDFSKKLDSNKILFLGKTLKNKGIYELINVLERLIKTNKDVQLYIAGDGENKKIEKIIQEKNIEKYVHILGWIDGEEKEKYLKECSIFVLPSYNEAMPMSLIEAMAYKNIPIATNVGGIPKVVQNGFSGIIIEPKNEEQLYEALEKCLNSIELREKISNNARLDIVKKFGNNDNLAKVLRLYDILI